MPRILFALLLGGLALPARAEVRTVVATPSPTLLRPVALVLAADWKDKIPATGRVNAPDVLPALHPGQDLAIGLLAEGDDRSRLLARVRATVRITVRPGGATQSLELEPVCIRAIKAAGADVALQALNAAGIGAEDRAKMEAATSVVSLAVLSPGWKVPASARAAEVEITGEVTGTESSVAIAPLRLPVKPALDWLQEPPLAHEALGKAITRHHGELAPGQLLAWLGAAAGSRALEATPVHGYFAFSFRTNPLARAAAVDAYPSLDSATQDALLRMLRLAGADLRRLFPGLPEATLARHDAVAALPDARRLPKFRDPVDVEAVRRLGNDMDLCWSGWMATGDKTYLRALVDLLAHPDDFPALEAWQKARGGAKGLSARVANGLAYQIAGWSIGSFQRADPLVADWLQYWESDPETPEVIRREIASLPANPAFRRN